jgi:hypothetical protein
MCELNAMVLWGKGIFARIMEDKVGEVTENRETKQKKRESFLLIAQMGG